MCVFSFRYNLYKGIVLSVQNEKFRFTLGKIQRIAYQVLKGLKKLHSLNILHCDLKPENISIEKENPYKVMILASSSLDFLKVSQFL
jgi:serine/threonine protein kinase